MPLSLFVSDLDNTLIGDDSAMEELNQRLSWYRNTNNTKIVYATGRSPQLYRKLQAEKNLLTPDALVTAVGTEVYYIGSDEPDRNWSEKLSAGWDRDLVWTVASRFADLEPQPNSEQRPFKVSYTLSKEVASSVLPKLEHLLTDKSLDVEIIYSDDRDVDILPRNANKGEAMLFLQQKWEIDRIQTVVCGDSGNDISLFSFGEEKGIVVGNAKHELLDWLNSNGTDKHYLARRFCARGILEGLDYFGL